MSGKLVVVTRMTSNNTTYQLALQATNILEVTEIEGKAECWLKYWEAGEVRNMRIVGRVSDVVRQVN